jgi:hypothetical protein
MQFQVGDRVTPIVSDRVPSGCAGREFIVRKVNPKKTRCDATDGGRGINFPHDMLVPATEESLTANTWSRPYVPTEFFSAGEIVTLNRTWRDWTPDTALVVMRDKGTRVNVTLLGGDSDRYLRCPREGLVRRDVAWLTEHLVDNA